MLLLSSQFIRLIGSVFIWLAVYNYCYYLFDLFIYYNSISYLFIFISCNDLNIFNNLSRLNK